MGHAETDCVVVIERFSVYSLLGFLFSFLLPERACRLAITVAIGLALLLDHPLAVVDVLQKIAGGIIGVLLAKTILSFLPRPPTRLPLRLANNKRQTLHGSDEKDRGRSRIAQRPKPVLRIVTTLDIRR